MEISFKLDEADVVALAKYHMHHSAAIRRRYHIRWLGVTMALATAGIFFYAFFSAKALGLYLLAFAVFFLVFYPYYDRWLVNRTLTRILGASPRPKVLAAQTLRMTAEGMELLSGGGRVRKTWNQIKGIEVREDRAFAVFDDRFTLVLPRKNLGEEKFQNLICTMERYAREASSPKA